MKTAKIYNDVNFDNSKPVITVLFETDFTKEIRIIMKRGTVMKEHKTKFPIVVEIVDGNIDFGCYQKVQELEKGSLIALDGNISHDLKANEDSVIRLTLTKYDNSQRVLNLIKTNKL